MSRVRPDPYHGLTDPDRKTNFFPLFPAYYFLKVHLHHFSKIKVTKKSQTAQTVEIKVFLLIFSMYSKIQIRIRTPD